MTSTSPCVVFVKEYASSEEKSFNLLRPGKMIAGYPDIIPIPSLDLKRQWYLYEEVSPLCINISSCDKPSEPKPRFKSV